ncbi:RHO1 GDP-GTP exchange protein 2 [Glugoides intestinalis]
MPNFKKKIEALAELYESEKSYIADLAIWKELLDACTDGRSKSSMAENLLQIIESIKKTHTSIVEKMKKRNIDAAIEADKKFSFDNKNDTDEFPMLLKAHKETTIEYFSVFSLLLENQKSYVGYIQILPRVEYEFEKMMHTSQCFSSIVNNFLINNDIVDLGAKNFLYRPSMKISRYPILIKAIAKNETNKKMQQKYIELIVKMDLLAKTIDSEYRKRAASFETFLLSYRLVYSKHIKNRFSLGLAYKKTKLIKEGKLIVKKNKLEPASYKQILIFNNVILICLTIDEPHKSIIIDDEPIFLSKVHILKNIDGFAQGENLGGLFPLFLVQKEHRLIKALYFEDESTRNLYFMKIDRAIQELNAGIDQNIKIKKLESFDDDILCYCKAQKNNGNFLVRPGDQENEEQANREEETFSERSRSMDKSSQTSTGTTIDSDSESIENTIFDFTTFGDEVEISTEVRYTPSNLTYNEVFTNEEYEEASTSTIESLESRRKIENEAIGICFYLCKSDNLPLHDIKIRNEFDIARIERNKRISVYSTKKGLFKEVNGVKSKIFTKSSTKIIYDANYELVMFLCEDLLYFAQLHADTEALEPKIFNITIENFFYGKKDDISYVALVSRGVLASTAIHILSISVQKNERILTLSICRKLYVGFAIFNMFFLNGRIIIAYKDFEIIEIDTLRTQELLESYDSILSLVAESKYCSTANSIFKIDKNTFLLCFDGGGHLIDRNGNFRKENVSYNWEMLGKEFCVYEKWILVAGNAYISAFEIETGKLVFNRYLLGAKFVYGSKKPLIYTDNELYTIDFGRRKDVLAGMYERENASNTMLDMAINMSLSTTSLYTIEKDYISGSRILEDEWESTKIEYIKKGGNKDSSTIYEWESMQVEYCKTKRGIKERRINKVVILIRKAKIRMMGRIAKNKKLSWLRNREEISDEDIIKEYE